MDINEIEEEILKLESGATTFTNCQKLASLYIVRDYFNSIQAKTVRYEEENEFVSVCKGISKEKIISVLNEHMEVIQILYPKEYNTLVNKLKGV